MCSIYDSCLFLPVVWCLVAVCRFVLSMRLLRSEAFLGLGLIFSAFSYCCCLWMWMWMRDAVIMRNADVVCCWFSFYCCCCWMSTQCRAIVWARIAPDSRWRLLLRGPVYPLPRACLADAVIDVVAAAAASAKSPWDVHSFACFAVAVGSIPTGQ